MKLHTASEVISFVRRLEGDSAAFYERLSQAYPDHRDLLLGFAKENGRNVTQIERAYYSVISDAIEGAFAFNVETDDYAPATGLGEGTALSAGLSKAAEVERTIVKFYDDAVAQSKPLMADVPRAFAAVAKRRGSRIATLERIASPPR